MKKDFKIRECYMYHIDTETGEKVNIKFSAIEITIDEFNELCVKRNPFMEYGKKYNSFVTIDDEFNGSPILYVLYDERCSKFKSIDQKCRKCINPHKLCRLWLYGNSVTGELYGCIKIEVDEKGIKNITDFDFAEV